MKKRARKIRGSVWFVGILAVAGVLVAACGDDDGEDTGNAEYEPGIVECTWDEESVAWDDEAPDGTVPADLIGAAEGDYEIVGGASYHDGEETFELKFERRGEQAIWMEEDQGGCGNRLDLPGTVELATAGGSLDESFEVIARAASSGGISVSHNFDASEIQGTWEPVPPESHELLGIGLELTFEEGEDPTGVVYMRTEFTDGDVVSAGPEQVYFW